MNYGLSTQSHTPQEGNPDGASSSWPQLCLVPAIEVIGGGEPVQGNQCVCVYVCVIFYLLNTNK